jgi:predicted metal-dependent hydrolase
MTNVISPTPFDYQIVRAKRKTVAIHVRNGSVEVRAPLRVSKHWINEFVTSKSNWVIKKLNEKPQNSIIIEDGAIIHYLGEPITISVLLASKKSVDFKNHQLVLHVKENNPAQVKTLFIEWLKMQAANYIEPRATRLTQQLDLVHKLQGFRFRVTRRTWGHCSSKGIIQFNPLVMLAPPDVIDYLITHEVCHLVHMNHSPRYWALVASICSHYKSSQKLLKALEPCLRLDD